MNLRPEVALHVLADGRVSAAVALSVRPDEVYVRVELRGDALLLLTRLRLLVASWASTHHYFVRTDETGVIWGEADTFALQTFVEGDERFDPADVAAALITLLRKHGLDPEPPADLDDLPSSRRETLARVRNEWLRAERARGGR